jgi:hypothetical protein
MTLFYDSHYLAVVDARERKEWNAKCMFKSKRVSKSKRGQEEMNLWGGVR